MCLNYGGFDSLNRAAGAEENQQLKQLVADLSLDKQMLQDVLKKSSDGAARAGQPNAGGWLKA